MFIFRFQKAWLWAQYNLYDFVILQEVTHPSFETTCKVAYLGRLLLFVSYFYVYNLRLRLVHWIILFLWVLGKGEMDIPDALAWCPISFPYDIWDSVRHCFFKPFFVPLRARLKTKTQACAPSSAVAWYIFMYHKLLQPSPQQLWKPWNRSCLVCAVVADSLM